MYACVFVRPPAERLVAAERLVHAFPEYLDGAVGECDLHHCGASGYLALVVHAAPVAFTREALARLAFWSARSGARGFVVGAVSEEEQGRLRAELSLCEKAVRGIPFPSLAGAAARFFREIGAPSGASAANARPVLAIDLDGPGSRGLEFRPESHALFVAGVLAPPRGDQLGLAIRHRGAAKPVEGWATVVAVRGRSDAAPGRPAGFALRIEGPSSLNEILAAWSTAQRADEARAAPRFEVAAPVKVRPAAAPNASAAAPAAAKGGEGPPASAPPPRVAIEYATEQEFAADWIENLSHGGAFVRTARPAPEGTSLVLDLALPDGVKLEAQAAVVFRNAQGMGVRFQLSKEADAILSSAIARISARPRRALVVDDDALFRRILADTLEARGFEVLTAVNGDDGIRIVSEELLALDLLVTDVCMPGRDGEELVRVIRKAGGEADLAIVAVSARVEPGLDERLAKAGSDAVLDKALGPEMIAQAADAALERRRIAGRAGAG